MNPAFNCCSSFVFSSVDNVTTGTKSFVSVIANVILWFSEVRAAITQLADQVKIKLISSLNLKFKALSKSIYVSL